MCRKTGGKTDAALSFEPRFTTPTSVGRLCRCIRQMMAEAALAVVLTVTVLGSIRARPMV
jgi:hypothetical protein